MAISSHGTTFTFSTPIGSLVASVTSLSIEEARPELVDMTGLYDDLAVRRVVATGDVTSPAKVQIDYLRRAADLALLAPAAMSGNFAFSGGVSGTLDIGHGSGWFVQKSASVESATTEMAVGEMIRGKITFVINNAP